MTSPGLDVLVAALACCVAAALTVLIAVRLKLHIRRSRRRDPHMTADEAVRAMALLAQTTQDDTRPDALAIIRALGPHVEDPVAARLIALAASGVAAYKLHEAAEDEIDRIVSGRSASAAHPPLTRRLATPVGAAALVVGLGAVVAGASGALAWSAALAALVLACVYGSFVLISVGSSAAARDPAADAERVLVITMLAHGLSAVAAGERVDRVRDRVLACLPPSRRAELPLRIAA